MSDYKIKSVEIHDEIEVIYNKYNDNFVNGYYGDNIPIGLLVEHMVTIQNANNDSLVYALYKPAELNIAWELIKHLINEKKITLLYQDSVIPFSQDKVITNIENKNFIDVLDKLVNFQSLISGIENLEGISTYDSRLRNIRKIYNDVLSNTLNKSSYNELKQFQTDRQNFINSLSKDQLKILKPKQQRKKIKADLILHIIRELHQENNKVPNSRETWDRIKKHHDDKNHFRNKKLIDSISDDLIIWKKGGQLKFNSFKASYSGWKKQFKG